MTQAQRLAEALRSKPDILVELLLELGIVCRGRNPVNPETGVIIEVHEAIENLGIRLCEHPACNRIDVVETPSQTRYEWDGEGRDPNQSRWLCLDHAEEYTETMNDQWKEYYSGLL